MSREAMKCADVQEISIIATAAGVIVSSVCCRLTNNRAYTPSYTLTHRSLSRRMSQRRNFHAERAPTRNYPRSKRTRFTSRAIAVRELG